MLKTLLALLLLLVLSSQLSFSFSNKITPIECSNGTKLQAKEGYKATSNGCGGNKYQV